MREMHNEITLSYRNGKADIVGSGFPFVYSRKNVDDCENTGGRKWTIICLKPITIGQLSKETGRLRDTNYQLFNRNPMKNRTTFNEK